MFFIYFTKLIIVTIFIMLLTCLTNNICFVKISCISIEKWINNCCYLLVGWCTYLLFFYYVVRTHHDPLYSLRPLFRGIIHTTQRIFFVISRHIYFWCLFIKKKTYRVKSTLSSIYYNDTYFDDFFFYRVKTKYAFIDKIIATLLK